MKNHAYVVLGILALALRLAAQPSPEHLARLDSALTFLHETGQFSGVVLVGHKGIPIYVKALGIANIETGEPLTSSSSFNLASLSQQFVAVMIMQLKQAGKLDYDDKLKVLLPDFPYDNISIRHLLTHSSGLPEYQDLAIRYNHTLDTLSGQELLQMLSEVRPPLLFEPGTQWQHSNTGYVLLSLIIAQASGMAIEDYFRQNITKPLGLKDSYVYYFGIKKDTRSGHQHVMGFDRENGKNRPHDLTRLHGVTGDGNIYCSATDLLKWERALMSNALLKSEIFKEAYRPVRLNNGGTANYGLGYFIKNEGKKLTQSGSLAGFYHYMERDLERETMLVFLSNATDSTALHFVTAILNGQKTALPTPHLINNVLLVDGTGLPARKTSVRLLSGKIWEIGDLRPFKNEMFTDGKGYVLAPGFIDTHSHHFGGLEKVPEAIPTANQGITTIVIGQDGGSYPMDTLEAFFKRKPVALNVASYTGHATLRQAVMGGKNLFRKAIPLEVASMGKKLAEEMEKGSFGLATGLEYESSFFSNRDEVLQLAGIAARYGGRYISHIRSEDINMDEAITEIIDIGRKAKLPVQVSHIKIAKRDNWGNSPQLLARLQAARAEGIDITADCYPYDFWNSTLKVLFPNRDYDNLQSAEFACKQLFDPAASVLIGFAPNKSYIGKTIAEIAALRQENPAATLVALIRMADEYEAQYPDSEEDIETIMGKSMLEEDVLNFLNWPHTNICSDGSSRGHPRGHGSYPRVLGRYVREQKRMPLETAIHKMTALAAEHIGITDRGMITNGYWADLVLFDPATVIDHANVSNGTALSAGIEMVWVNGELIYQAQKPTGKYPGVLIKRNKL